MLSLTISLGAQDYEGVKKTTNAAELTDAYRKRRLAGWGTQMPVEFKGTGQL